MPKLFRKPSESDVSDNKKLTPAQTVRALYSAQWKFYKFGYDTMVKISVAQFLIILVLGVTIMFMAMNGNPEPRYFLVNQHNQFVPVEPLTEPGRSDEQVRQFAADTILAAMNFTHDDYKLRLNDAAHYFTDEGIAAWNNALVSSRLIDQVKERQLLVRTQLLSTPVIDKSNSKNYGGIYAWTVYVDVIRTMSDRNESRSSNYKYKVMIRRVPTTERASGLAVYSLKEEGKLNQ